MLTDKEIAEIEERIDHIPYHVLSRETCNDLEKVFSTVKEQRQKLFVQDMELQLLRPLKDKLEDLTSSRIVQSQEIQITDLEEKLKEQRELLRKVDILKPISERLNTQDNRITAEPMFCVEMKVRDTGLDSAYSDNRCWWNAEQMEIVHDDDPDFKEPEGDGWDEFGYRDRWETVMVAFTEAGCKEYLDADGHNVRRQAFRGEVRIYVKSFHRCAEMIAVRKALMGLNQIEEAGK